MDWKKALPKIITQPGSRLRFAEPLAKHTYFGIGGEATAYIEISTISELAATGAFPQAVGCSDCRYRSWVESTRKRHGFQGHRCQVNRRVGETGG